MNNNLMERKKEEALCRMRLMGLREEYIRDFEQDAKFISLREMGRCRSSRLRTWL